MFAPEAGTIFFDQVVGRIVQRLWTTTVVVSNLYQALALSQALEDVFYTDSS